MEKNDFIMLCHLIPGIFFILREYQLFELD